MSELHEVGLRTLSIARFTEVVGEKPVKKALSVAHEISSRMSGRTERA